MTAPEPNQVVVAQRAARRRLHELAETQRFVHHVADLASGRVLSTELDRPVTPLSRARRLARLGHTPDAGGITVLGGPSYLLTPRRPYQPAPEASLIVSRCDYSATDDEVLWQPARDAAGPADLGGLRAFFAVSPDVRSVVSIALSGSPWPGTVGHILITETQSDASVQIPIDGTFATHTLDLTFIPLGGRLSDVLMSLQRGIELLTFTSIALRPLPPLLNPGRL